MRLPSLLILILFLAPSSVRASEKMNAESCQLRFESIRSDALTQTSRIYRNVEDLFFRRFQYIETLYNPLWQANFKRSDRFSPAQRAEGEVLYGRYQHEANTQLGVARQTSKDLRKDFAKLVSLSKSIPDCCSFAGFKNCVQENYSNLLDLLRGLKKNLRFQEALLRDLSHKASLTISENPSEHYRFPDRYQDALNEWQYKHFPAYLKIMREIHSLLETQLPQNCCAECASTDIDSAQDPVLSQIRPESKAGKRGISNAVVNKVDLLQAFDRAEAEGEKN